MKKALLLYIFACILYPVISFAQNENVGIIKGIWFSDTQFFDGDTIRVYTAVQNNSGSDVEGTIEFFDNDVSLGEKDFSALNGRIIESWIDTLAISGEHEFSVKINQLQKNDVGSIVESITAQSTFSERLAVVKIDTDGDRISDDVDTDDDGDGFSDSEEQESGTRDPLDKNEIPKDKEKINNETVLSTIQDVINKLFPKDDAKEANTIAENLVEIKNEAEEGSLDESPEFIQELSEDNNLVKSLSLQINSIQNASQGFIEKEQLKINNSKYPKIEKITTENTIQNNVEEVKESKKNSKNSFLTTLYSLLLNLFHWLFSLWWFVVVLLFLGIYIFLRILFKIFGKHN